MKKAIALAGVTILSLLALTGCRIDSGQTYDVTQGGMTEFRYKYGSGEMLDCLKFSDKITCWISPDQTTRGK